MLRFTTKSTVRWVALCCVLLAAPTIPAWSAETIAAKDDESVSILKGVLSYFGKEYSPGGPMVKVLEIGGGDPAMNGAQVYVSIEYAGNAYLWDTGLNVQIVNQVRFAQGNRILLDVKQDFMDASSSIFSKDMTYSIMFFIEDDILQNKVAIESVH